MSRSRTNARARIAACGLAPVLAFLLTPSALAAESIPNPDPARFESEIAAFEAWDRQNSFPRDGILFVGSSSIRMWPTADSFPGLPVINRGFGGSQASDVNHFAERIVFKYSPRTIVFYSGDNDIAGGKPPEQVAEDFREFAALVRNRLPDTRLIFLPTKPSVARWAMWPKMQQTNALVQEFAAADPQIEVVDTATPLLGSDGKPRPDLYLEDGLHLNDAGYAIWNGILTKTLTAP